MPTHRTITNHPQALGAGYAVTLPTFQGPLDLLLHLIETQELDINLISLMSVTDQYWQTVGGMKSVEPGALADFLVVASRLLYIKSRGLLPQPAPGPSEAAEEEDSADALIRQLLEYRQFKAVAENLKQRQAQGLHTYPRSAPPPAAEKRLDLNYVDAAHLRAVLRKLLQRIPENPPLPTVKTYSITVAEQISVVRRLLHTHQASHKSHTTSSPISFIELLGQTWTRVEVIVTFLAVLELIKQQEVQAVQRRLFGDILLVPMTQESLTAASTTTASPYTNPHR